MAMIEWTEDLSVGIASVDQEHRNLITLLDDLFEAALAKKRNVAALRALDALVTATSVHFRNEEGFFARTGYPQTQEHAKEHADLMAQIKAFQATCKEEPEAHFSMDMLTFLRHWLFDHIEGMDKKYASHLLANGIR